MKHTINYLKETRSLIVFESNEDEGAAEYYSDISHCIDSLEKGTMTIKEAGEALGIDLSNR